jgi:uncharacterized membrane protein
MTEATTTLTRTAEPHLTALSNHPAAAQFNLLAMVSLIGLIAVCLAWELWLAPLRPGGSWLVLKTLPLLAPLFGIIRGKRYTHQWASLLILLYVAEGSTRIVSEEGMAAVLAVVELTLATLFFVGTIAYTRLTRPTPTGQPAERRARAAD